jgi:hypothetical protein
MYGPCLVVRSPHPYKNLFLATLDVPNKKKNFVDLPNSAKWGLSWIHVRDSDIISVRSFLTLEFLFIQNDMSTLRSCLKLKAFIHVVWASDVEMLKA